MSHKNYDDISLQGRQWLCSEMDASVTRGRGDRLWPIHNFAYLATRGDRVASCT